MSRRITITIEEIHLGLVVAAATVTSESSICGKGVAGEQMDKIAGRVIAMWERAEPPTESAP